MILFPLEWDQRQAVDYNSARSKAKSGAEANKIYDQYLNAHSRGGRLLSPFDANKRHRRRQTRGRQTLRQGTVNRTVFHVKIRVMCLCAFVHLCTSGRLRCNSRAEPTQSRRNSGQDLFLSVQSRWTSGRIEHFAGASALQTEDLHAPKRLRGDKG